MFLCVQPCFGVWSPLRNWLQGLGCGLKVGGSLRDQRGLAPPQQRNLRAAHWDSLLGRPWRRNTTHTQAARISLLAPKALASKQE